ncbi:MFS transporter [Lactobacillus panisapium]|uniref:MFS transporter n=1 Tax=Lactobacillus panisapium TaxID=2012495 RepID=UPI001C6A56D6|nr:MFS transporter [Lactobacillus panisapium]QYN56047.1 MFS transporter [Lactobacillus panisapium]
MNKPKLKISILSMSLLTMSFLVITNAFGAMTKSFPNVPVAKIQMIGTVPSLGTLIATIVVGILGVKYSKKSLSLIGLLITTVGGLLPLVIHGSVDVLIGCAFILGFGLGFVNTLIPMLISIFFEGEERNEMMGKNTAMNSLGSILMMFGGGLLGAKSWVNSYWVFLLGIFVFLLVLFVLPTDKVDYNEKSVNSNVFGILGNLNGYIWLIGLITLLMGILYTIYPTNLSIVIDQKQLGSTSITGIVNAVGTAGGFIAGFSLKYLNKIFKDKIIASGFITLGITFLLGRTANSLVLICIGGILSGFAMSMIMSTIPFYMSVVSHKYELAVSMMVFQFMNSIGGFISPVLLNLLHIKAGEGSFTFGCICCFVIGLICILANLGKRIMSNSVKEG